MSTLDEHRGYLIDARRLDAFRQVLDAVVQQGDLVADIGCGSGILGLLCLHADAAKVWGIDSTDAIEIARETMRQAGFADRYTCIYDLSFRAALPERVDLVVCDHVGYFGIDYGIIATLGDARRRFLKPDGRIVPERIDLTLALAGSAELRAKADAWGAPGIPAEYRWLREYGVNTKHAHSFAADEIGSEPAVIGSVDLTSDSADHLRFSASLTASRDGTLDGLAGWFDCELGQGVRMTNSPLAEDRIDRSQMFLPFSQSIDVTAGDAIEVSLSVRHVDGLIAWTVSHPRSGRRLKQSTWNSRLLSKADLRRNPERSIELSHAARARQVVCGYIDGVRTAGQIEQAVLRDHPDLFPSSEEIARFVRRELSWSSAE